MQTEIKAINSRMNNAEEQISDLEDSKIEITKSGLQRENKIKKRKKAI